jgi:hypothetical protein
MSQILSYPAVYWSVRILVILASLGIAWVMLLVLARFFRPRHIGAMLRADPPKVEELAAEFKGFKARLRFNAQATALGVLENRMEVVEISVERLWGITEEHSRGLAKLSVEEGDAD